MSHPEKRRDGKGEDSRRLGGGALRPETQRVPKILDFGMLNLIYMTNQLS